MTLSEKLETHVDAAGRTFTAVRLSTLTPEEVQEAIVKSRTAEGINFIFPEIPIKEWIEKNPDYCTDFKRNYFGSPVQANHPELDNLRTILNYEPAVVVEKNHASDEDDHVQVRVYDFDPKTMDRSKPARAGIEYAHNSSFGTKVWQNIVQWVYLVLVHKQKITDDLIHIAKADYLSRLNHFTGGGTQFVLPCGFASYHSSYINYARARACYGIMNISSRKGDKNMIPDSIRNSDLSKIYFENMLNGDGDPVYITCISGPCYWDTEDDMKHFIYHVTDSVHDRMFKHIEKDVMPHYIELYKYSIFITQTKHNIPGFSYLLVRTDDINGEPIHTYFVYPSHLDEWVKTHVPSISSKCGAPLSCYRIYDDLTESERIRIDEIINEKKIVQSQNTANTAVAAATPNQPYVRLVDRLEPADFEGQAPMNLDDD